MRPPEPRIVVAGSARREVQLAAERVEHYDSDPDPSAPAQRLQPEGACRADDNETREAVGRPGVPALPAVGAETIGDYETPSVHANRDAEAIGYADGTVRRVAGKRLGESGVKLGSGVTSTLGCGHGTYLPGPAPGTLARRPGHLFSPQIYGLSDGESTLELHLFLAIDYGLEEQP